MAVWHINGQTPESLGVKALPPSLRLYGPSSMILRIVQPFDAAEAFSYGMPVALARDGIRVFSGKVTSVPKWGGADAEGHDIVVEDAWAELERTVYQEMWAVGSGAVALPKAILGLSAPGEPISTTEQVAAAASYAASQGVAIAAGSISGGIMLWPEESANMTVADVIVASLRLTPGLVPWIDYAPAVPTLNVTPISGLPGVSFPVDGSGDVADFTVTRRDDLMPEAVRIIYTTATNIDGEVYRDGIIDKHPSGGPDGGPKVLGATIELAGGDMQFQKQRIKTRTLPTDNASARTWLKKKFPALAGVPDEHWELTEFSKELVDEDGDDPEPINPNSEPLVASNAGDLPRELVSGAIEDWMRVKVGRVEFEWTITTLAPATPETTKIIRALPPYANVVSTDAVTKRYTGVTNWTPPEQAPVGLAAAIYASVRAAYQWEGSVTVRGLDAPAERLIAARLNLTGGAPGWAGMNALVHAVDYDVESGAARISFGPVPHLAPADFLELQRVLRGRRPTWMSGTERASATLGDEAGPGSRGDTVGPYRGPAAYFLGGGGGESVPGPWEPVLHNAGSTESPDWEIKLAKGSLKLAPAGTPVTVAAADTEFSATSGNRAYLEAAIDAAGAVTSVTAKVGAAWDGFPQTVKFATSTPFAQTLAFVELGEVATEGSSLTVKGRWASGNILIVDAIVDGRLAKIFTPGN